MNVTLTFKNVTIDKTKDFQEPSYSQIGEAKAVIDFELEDLEITPQFLGDALHNLLERLLQPSSEFIVETKETDLTPKSDEKNTND